MGAPKQKWTPEEEAALRAGVARYGIGKWSAILKDPEFSGLLRSRSNVDLKDKWRNIHVMESGLGSRQRGRPSSKSTPLQLKPSLKPSTVVSTVVEKSPEVLDNTKQLTVYTETPPPPSPPPPITTLKKQILRLDDVALKAITKLNEPHGSTRKSIALYIEKRYAIPTHFKELLATNLQHLVEIRKLTKENHLYRLSASPVPFMDTTPSLMDSSNAAPTKGSEPFTVAQVENDLNRMRGMNARDAAEAAAKAVAEAEAALADAAAAAMEAENLETEAESAYCFHEATRKTLSCTNHPRLVKSSL